MLVVRWAFGRGAAAAAAALEKHVPANVVARGDLVYDPASADGTLDAYYPESAGTQPLPTIVWVHGGGHVSGSKADVGNYCRVLAGRGFLVVAVGYTIAPEATFPVPVRQVNDALAWLVRNEARLPRDARRVVLAGDSAGAGIAAQLAHAIVAPEYARALGLTAALSPDQLAGTVLCCGVYGVDGIDLDGPFGGFLRTVLWAYFGNRDPVDDPRMGLFSVLRHVGAAFPPAFVTAGNGDPLLAQSEALAARLAAAQVRTDTLFFAADRSPPLPHEYQFDLDGDAGRQALERMVAFVRSLL